MLGSVSQLSLFCPSGFAVTGHVDGLSHSRIFVTEVLSDGIAFGEGNELAFITSTSIKPRLSRLHS